MVTLSTMSGYDNSAHNTRNLHRDGSGFTAQSLCRFQKKRNHCEKGKKYTLEDLYNTMDNTYWVVCFTPMFKCNSHSVISGSIDNTTVE